MIRMNQFRSAREAKDYYTAALEAGDYYTAAEQDSPWMGELAKRLGLDGLVTKDAFGNLCENLHPLTGKQLTPRTDADRTVANDINFHVPKGISVLHLVSQDDRIIDAIREAMRETMRDVEKQARTRVRRGGKQEEERTTGELAWGEFVHTTTRPDKDGVPDIHLHAHCFVFNVTWDEEERRMKAVQFRDMKRDMPYHQAAFYNRLAWRLEEIGYRTERTAKGWDVAGIPDSVKRKFSRRTAEIEALAKRLGIKSASRKAELGAKTRGKKNKMRLSAGELRKEWMSRLTKDELGTIERLAGQRSPARNLERGERAAAESALEKAIAHKFERESVIAEPRLLQSALSFGVGEFRPHVLREAANAHPELLRRREGTQRFVTTRSVLAEEEAMLRLAREGRGVCRPLEGKTPYQPGYANLSKEKQRVLAHLMKSRDRVMIVRGGPGTGKTSLLKEFAKELKGRGHPLVALASTSDASRNTLRKHGFEQADTIAAFLNDPKRQEAARGGVIWADESGMIGTPTMKRLLETVKRLNARLVPCGDTQQHSPQERGDAQRLLETRAGLQPAGLSEIMRQQGTYREAVEAIQKGQYDKGIETLDRLGAIREVKGQDWTPLIFDYIHTIKTGRSSMVIAPTHAHGDELTTLIRASLQREGKLGSDERLVPRIRDLRWTQTERGDAAHYQEGQVVVFHRAVRSGLTRFSPGERFEVIGKEANGKVRVRDENGNQRELPLSRSANFSVNAADHIRLAPGESIRASANGRTLDGKHRVNNGAVFRIAGFEPDGNLRLDNGWVVDREFARFEHAYVSTSHAAQGRTVDHVYIAQGSMSLAASSLEQLFVSITRGKQNVSLYTDDRSILLDVIGKSSTRRSAVELAEGTSGAKRSQEHADRLVKLRQYEQQREQSQNRTRGKERGHERS